MKISVVIPICNAFDDIKRLLKSLNENFDFNLGNIILVDDFSNIQTKNFLDEFIQKNSHYTLERNDENLGFIKTCNKGIKLANNDIIVLLNSDTLIPKNFCEKIIQCFQKCQNVGIASPISSASLMYFITLPPFFTINHMNTLLDIKHTPAYPLIPSAEGFCYCIRKKVLDEIGLLDETYGKGYCEEIDFSYRAIKNGWDNALIDNLYVYHKRCASFGQKQRQKLLKENEPAFNQKWQNFRGNYIRTNNLEKNPIESIKKELFPIFMSDWYLAIKRKFKFLKSIKDLIEKKH